MSQVITDELLKQCLLDFQNGMSLTKIGEKYDINRKSLSKRLKAEYEVKPLKDGKLPMDSHYFDVIDTADKAYWLGFLYADGYVASNSNIIELALNEADYNHVVLFQEAINNKNKLYYKTINNASGTKSHCWKLSFKDKQMKEDLIKHGCGPKKSHEIKLPSLTGYLMQHFIRGYFDGDGCILMSNRYTINITSGCLNMLEQLKLYLENELGVTMKIYQDTRSTSTYRLCCNRQEESLNILKYLYNNSTEKNRLARKYEKFLQFNCRLETKLQKSQDD